MATYWALTFDGETFREQDITIDQARRVEALTGKTWHTLDPRASAREAQYILAVFVADSRNMPLEEAAKKVGALKIDEFFDLVTTVEGDDLPTEFSDGFPPVGDATSTPG